MSTFKSGAYIIGWNEAMQAIEDKGIDRAKEYINTAARVAQVADRRNGLLAALSFYYQNQSTARQ